MSQFAAEAAPNTPVHTHKGTVCPITGLSGKNPHAFCPPQPGDKRAPCPAMNAMANHGYLPRDGRKINANVIIDALIACYKLSKPLAWFLTHGALTLLHQGSGDFDLSDLARHNHIEHNGSLYHDDAGERDEYAPITINEGLLDLVFEDSEGGKVMTPEDIAKVRVRREATSHPPIDLVHAELARGEVGIVLNCFNNPDPELHAQGVALQPRGSVSKFLRRLVGKKGENSAKRQLDGVPIERLREWFKYEKLPEGWAPYHTTTLLETVVTGNRLRSTMRKLAKAEKKKTAQAVKDAPVPVKETVSAPAPLVLVEPKKIAVEAAPATTESEEDSESDGERNTLDVPAFHHQSESSYSSTNSEFSMPDTPRSSELLFPLTTSPVQKHQDFVVTIETIPEASPMPSTGEKLIEPNVEYTAIESAAPISAAA